MRNQPIVWVLSIALAALALPVIAQQEKDMFGTTVQDVKLEMPQKGWDHKLDSLKKANPEARLFGTVFVNGQRFDSTGVRYKGNSSYFRTRNDVSKKLPFNIKVDFKRKNQKVNGQYGVVRLSNGFLDPSFVRDPLSYEIVRKYMPASQCNFAKLHINGKYYGLYVNTESVDLNFVKKHFGSTKGFLVKCDPDQWERTRSQSGCPKGENASLAYLNDNTGCYDAFYEVDDPAAWPYLINLIKILNKTPDKIETVLDVDQTLWMHALNNAMVNLDSYTGSLSHNYYLWFDSVGVGHPIMWDFNMGFGGWRRDFSFQEMPDQALIQYSPIAEIDNAKRPLISKLLKMPLYRKIYLAHLRTIINDNFKSELYLTRAKALQKEIDPWVKQDSIKLYSYTHFQESLEKAMKVGPDNIIGIKQLMEKRTAWLLQHPLMQKVPPAIAEAKHAKDGDQTKVTAKLTNATVGYLFYRTDKRWAFARVDMKDDGTAGDATAGDGVFTASVPSAKIKQYYVVAENADGAALFPEKASYEFLKAE